MINKKSSFSSGRRKFISLAGTGFVSMALASDFSFASCLQNSKRGERSPDQDPLKAWVPVSDRKIKVGIVGYGTSKFGALFGFQNHPNVEVVAVSDLYPDRCAELAKVTNCKTTYPSLEKLVKDDSIEAVFVATDAPSHMQHCIKVLNHGKHVASAVPAVWGSLEDAEKLYEAVKVSGLKYMMFETSCFREDNYAMRQIYNADGFGKIVYAEGEYFHGPGLEPSKASSAPAKPATSKPETGLAYGTYNMNWRSGLPPQWYPTHSNAYYIGVTNGTFTEVSCMGMPGTDDVTRIGKNQYNNPFSAEAGMFRTNEGGMARMVVAWNTPGFYAESGRVRGQKGAYLDKYEGFEKNLPDLARPPLPAGITGRAGLDGDHGGSHGLLMDEFVTAILQNRKPLVDIAMALNMTVPGIVAHQSALKGGELMKIPQYKF